MKRSRKISLWLLPSEQDAAILETRIRQLAQKQGTHPFAAHLTLYSPIVADPDALREQLLPICQNTAPLLLESHGLSHSDQQYRALVIEMQANEVLSDWHRSLQISWNPSDPRRFAPHISLLYQELAEQERIQLLADILPQNSFQFDRLAAIATETSDAAGHRYQDWEHLWTLPLSG